MRLLTTFTKAETETLNPFAFSYFLLTKGIENQCEDQGPESYRIWIVDEDQVGKAESYLEEYRSNPNDPKFKSNYETALRAANIIPPVDETTPTAQKRRFLSPSPYGKLSIVIIIAAILIFFISMMQKEAAPLEIPGVPKLPVLPKIERLLLYDYPLIMQLQDDLLKVYPKKAIDAKEPPPPEAVKLIKEIQNTPVWTGFYDRIVSHIKDKDTPLSYHGPLFEKISQGQLWRLITPIFLHYDFIHIFFNLLWFMLLANQIEYRIGFWRYLLLILLSAIVSNTAQYLMSGPLFMGLSGVVVALAGFIFARQQAAPWEGYLLHRLTLLFLAIFVFGVFLLQVIFFFLQISGNFNSTIPIANTAHISGGIIGYLLGRLRFFSLQPK